MIRAHVVVRLRPGILDPQGATIQRALQGLGYPEVQELRVGKVIEISLAETDPVRARARVDEMCRRLLANPVVEDYEIRLDAEPSTAPRPPRT